MTTSRSAGPPLTDRAVRAFLLDAPVRTAALATTRADGRPHLAPVWFALDGEELVFNTGDDTVKGRNLARDGRCALLVEDPPPNHGYVLVEGTTRLVDDLDEVRRWAGEIGARYRGEEQREALAARNGVPGELLVRVTPTKVVFLPEID